MSVALICALGAISGDGGGDEKIEGRCGSSRAIRVLSPNSLARPAVRPRVWAPTGWFCLWAVQWVDGRASHNEGLPPSAADKGNGRFDNPIYPGDCAEVDSLKPDARPGWQARVYNACQ